MRLSWPLLAFLATSSVFCGGPHDSVHDPSAPGADAPSLLERHVKAGEGLLTFPATEAGRRARPSMPTSFDRRNNEEPRVVEPELDGNKHFDTTAERVRILFNQAMQRPAARPGAKGGEAAHIEAEAGTLTITPAVAGTTRWLDAHTLEFVPRGPMTLGKEHKVVLGALKTTAGDALAEPFEATFVPRATVGGKLLDYLPTLGDHRVVAVRPHDGSTVGRQPTLSVLFDQPISIGAASALVRLEDDAGKAVPVLLDHPHGNSLEGVRIDPRYAVLVTPRQPLTPDKNYTVGARNRAEKPDQTTVSVDVHVADPLKVSGVECGWSWRGHDGCTTEGGVVRTSGNEVHVVFNNAIATSNKQLEQLVSVVPRPKNLAIRNYPYGGEGRVVISGSFQPSQRYAVSLAGVTDSFGDRLGAPHHFRVDMKPVGASATMHSGVMLLDPATAKKFRITTRNVATAVLDVWGVDAGAEAFEKAVTQARAREVPSAAATSHITVPIAAVRDQLVETEVDLSAQLAAGKHWLLGLRIDKPVSGAEPVKFDEGSEAAKPSVALVTPGNAETLSVHTREIHGTTLVQVARLATGEPIAGASVTGAGAGAPLITDANGVALLVGSEGATLTVKAGNVSTEVVRSDTPTRAAELFPALAVGVPPSDSDLRAVVITDRGIYRPGAKVEVKASLRRPEGDRLIGVRDVQTKLRLLGPTGDEVAAKTLATSETGGVAATFALPPDAKLGRHQVVVEDAANPDPPLARSIVQVAEFEPPRFAVDVEAERHGDANLRAKVRARYLFGAPMDGATLAWTLKREPAALPQNPLADAGLAFRKVADEWRDDETVQAWTRSGQGKLAADGTLQVDQAFSLVGSVGPQQLVLEADVSDSSNRHVAGRNAVIVHPVPRYAGLKVGQRWAKTGESIPVELGVVDTKGQPVVGADVSARLVDVSWSYVRRAGVGKSVRYEWTARRTDAGRCSVKSGREPVSCKLTLPRYGDYEVVAEVDGHGGGSASVWAWSWGSDAPSARPGRARTVEVITDKGRYAPGETAKLLVMSPYPAATAILTVEQSGLLSHQAKRIDSAAVFEVPLTAQHAPHVHATVTLLPIGAKGAALADFRIGAVRLPVALSGARLDVAARSTRPSYQPGEEAEVVVEVKDGGQPQPGAEVVVGVVDEGVLRMTNYHPPDPAEALRPGRALAFEVRDSRSGLAELLERSHVAGDGGGEGETITSTRKNFVETAHWAPAVRTDQSGRATVRFKLPDNLTQFRITALALDDEGKGGTTESDFTVKKPIMAVPVVPRFASLGDSLELAAMVQNNTEQPFEGEVTLGGEGLAAPATAPIVVPAGGHTRVAFPFVASAIGTKELAFAVKGKDGAPRDSVISRLPVDVAGYDERPTVSGTFARNREVDLQVPADVRAPEQAAVTIQAGQHLWPELGERVAYLMHYPYGCVEQTTSSTLPLIAGRDILPRVGMQRFSDDDLRRKIQKGLERLASMRTTGGGLSYWPGDDEPNIYGTAYAVRAVILAKRGGIAPPPGLLEGMQTFLADRLLGSSVPPEVQAAIAQSLAEVGELSPSAADALFDKRDKLSVFGAASLAMALSSLTGQEDRVQKLLDDVEDAFDEQGAITRHASGSDFSYFGSDTRSTAQASMALTRLRPRSVVLPRIINGLADDIGSYTTQATAYSLLALAQHLGDKLRDGAEVRAFLDGQALEPARELGFGAREYRVPLAAVRGKKARLRLEGAGDAAIGFAVSAAWRRPAPTAGGDTASLASTSAASGPDVYRIYTNAKGERVDLAHVKAGDVLRVAILARLPTPATAPGAATWRSPIACRRASSPSSPIWPPWPAPRALRCAPLAWVLRYGEGAASHVELRDDRVHMYFDRVWGEHIAATYLVRASTPGTFSAAPAMAELMYEGNSAGYSEATKVVIE
ncbi:MAG: MG2 domain-containing protein [Polyangiaceae bacterium]